MNKKITLIEQILQQDYYNGNIEEGVLRNDEFSIYTYSDKYTDLIPSLKLRKEIKKFPANMSLIKDDGSVILTVKLSQEEANTLADELKLFNKDAYSYRLDWRDERDFRSEERKRFDSLVDRLDSSASYLKYKVKANAPFDSNLKCASDMINRALKLLEQAKIEL